jgi:hypothetical protein
MHVRPPGVTIHWIEKHHDSTVDSKHPHAKSLHKSQSALDEPLMPYFRRVALSGVVISGSSATRWRLASQGSFPIMVVDKPQQGLIKPANNHLL